MVDQFKNHDEVELAEQTYAAITLYTIGFLAHSKDSKGREALVPSGSGVLADIGGVKGIITAAHVVRELQKVKRIGLFTIVNKRPRARHLEFSSSEMTFVLEGGERNSPDGPDLGFVLVPQNIQEHLQAENAFYNFELRFRDADRPHARVVAHLLSGVIAEKSELKEISEKSRVDTHTMVHGGGLVSNERDSSEGFDIFDFDFSHNEDVRRPNTYGGLSGAAVWRTNTEGEGVDRLVFGIAFYETEANERGERTVICHGPKSIYAKLVDMVGKQFAGQFKKFA